MQNYQLIMICIMDIFEANIGIDVTQSAKTFVQFHVVNQHPVNHGKIHIHFHPPTYGLALTL